MNNKTLLNLLFGAIVISLFLGSLYLKKTQDLSSSQNSQLNPTEVRAPSKTEIDRLNQNSTNIPEGYTNLPEYFRDQHLKFSDDCKKMEISGASAFLFGSENFQTEFNEKLDLIKNHFNLNSRDGVTFLQSVANNIGDNYCVFIDIEKNGVKYIYYIDKNEIYREIKL